MAAPAATAAPAAAAAEETAEVELLDRVFLRLALADSDIARSAFLQSYLAPILLKFASPHAKTRAKVLEVLAHINKVAPQA
jgi:proteasome component ECM29